MYWWIELKKQNKVGSVLDLVVEKKVPPSFLFFNISGKAQGLLHVSELNWNFGLCQTDFRNIKVGSTLKVNVIGFDDKYKKVHLSRKNLPIIERPCESTAWKMLSLKKEIIATVFEEYRNKVIVQLNSGLFATIPLLENNRYTIGDKIHVIPIRKNSELNIIECTLREVSALTQNQTNEVIKTFKEQTTPNSFSTSEFYLNSYQQLSESLYWNYFSQEEKDIFKSLFEKTENLFSKVEKGEEPIYFEFDFDYNAYNDFVRNIAPAVFEFDKLPEKFTEKDFLSELSKFGFWFTQYDFHRKIEATEQKYTEKSFTLFNETVSIRGIVSDEGSLKIRLIKAKVKTESLREKQTALKNYDVFYINRPIIFSQFAPVNTANKKFVESIDNKILAFKLFEVAKNKSLDLLQQQGKEFKIFSNFLESQIDFEIKANDETELKIVDCKLDSAIQTEGITFIGKAFGEHKLKPDDKISISIEIKKDKIQRVGIGSVFSKSEKEIKIKSNIENFDLVKGGVIVKKLFSVKQYDIQLSVLNKFFANKLPLDNFYKIFHDKNGIEPPERVDIKFINPVFQNKNNPQTQAVEKAVGNKNILLIQGPPGTGKTTVITEIVKQLIKRGEKILVTSQTHIAVDNVLERIKNDLSINIARIGSINSDSISDFALPYFLDEATKKFSEKVQKIVDIKIEILNHHNMGKDISQLSKQDFELPLSFDWENIKDFIILIQSSDLKQTTLFSETLEHWKKVIAKTPKLLTNLFLQNLNVLFGTCIGIATNKEIEISEIIFDTVILDEAGKANISETLTAISKAKKIILVGDHKQLPPYLDSERVEYFKKFSKDIREQKTSDFEIKQALGASFFEFLQKEGVLNNENKILLSEQHRMHPDIGNFVSQSFYDSELLNGQHTHQNVIPLPEPFDKQIIFIDTSSDNGSAETFKDGSYFNQVEADLIVNKVIPELDRNNISLNSYAIVSPYSKQCERIKEMLFEKNQSTFNSIEVATLDSFQGREHDIIIFSFTRSAVRNRVGFLDDARRLNVAFSRAKKKLILIGNKETLTSKYSHYDSYYTNLFDNLWRYASKYGETYRINELDFKRSQTHFQVGQVLKASINRFERYGVLVNLGRKHGLIPNSELSWKYFKNSADLFKINQEIDVKIIQISEMGILLSHKETIPRLNLTNNYLPKPGQAVKSDDRKFDLFNKEFKALDVVEGTITKIIEGNLPSIKVIVALKYGVVGIFYTSTKNNRVKVGNKIRVEINKIDTPKQTVKCKIKL
ncbi:AAA domain-containing protein [Sediminibacterium sp. C3]|uniref:AAA domain-containing protein n=1 Tax=Sediminibacterium sp. C3 TaxID=1267211 RepID=UPI000429B9F3|nr:AAA domain-containing protein [Sediminibacterium sp. C3]